MNFYKMVKRARAGISLKTEYKIRRGCYRILPVKAYAPSGSFFHVRVPKTASQFVRLVLSDPTVYRQTGKLPYACVGPDDISIMGKRSKAEYCFLNSGQTKNQLGNCLANARGIFVVRDPKDLFISWYVSQRYTHDSNPTIDQFRGEVEGKSDADGMRSLMDDFVRLERVLCSWRVLPEGFICVRFEDIVGNDRLFEWRRIFDLLGCAASDRQIEKVLARYEYLLKGADEGTAYNYDKSHIRKIFEGSVETEWLHRFGHLYSLPFFVREGENWVSMEDNA